MVDITNYLDDIENNVMSELKDFQIATVERIDELYRTNKNRILVSDEVGLGKTLVARGTIAKFAKLRFEEGDNLVKVVYICSNATIAEQNIERLKIVRNVDVGNAVNSRLSMQHLNIFMQENDDDILNSYIQIIPLTPETSFKISNSQGTVNERALMFAILKRHRNFKYYQPELEKIFRYGVRYWDEPRDYWENQVKICNEKSKGNYQRYMLNEIKKHSQEIKELYELCRTISKKDVERIETKPVIVKFRIIFADISLNKLDPDLIIMDEFQRFKFLIDNSNEETEMGKLISRFFNMEDMRILMLSATPYKMYSTLDEIFEDEVTSHFKEFLAIMDFLIADDEDLKKFKSIWKNYSIELKEFNKNNLTFISAKNRAEKALYNNICRTERISENHLSDFIDDEDSKHALRIFKEDVISFKQAQKLLDDIGLNINVPVDYIKSTPYIMSFMKDYQLKKKIESYFKENPRDIYKMDKDTFWLDKDKIDRYEKIPYNNARLDNLMSHVLKDNAEKLLWIPPSKPYYKLKGVFENINNFSKTLIFSSWEMVPRMISSLVSYEIERRTIGQLKNEKENIHYFSKDDRYPSSRLNFTLSNDKPRAMSLFTLLYPSLFLVDAYNPVDCLNRNLSIEAIEKEVKSKIKLGLSQIPYRSSSKDVDLRWYYLAPLFLDKLGNEDLIDWWFEDIDQLIFDEYYKQRGFKNHFAALKQEYIYGLNSLGRMPDDLADVLCDMAIASPAICAYRLYENEFGSDGSLMDLFNIYSMKIARKFIDFMNLTESISVIDLIYKNESDVAYWKNVLRYAKEGNFQAVLDEYVHLLSSGLYNNNEEKIQIITKKLLTSFNLRTTSYDFDTFAMFKYRMQHDETDLFKSLRTHFAVSFTKGRSDEKDANRKKSVRDAFNSPFRPFVLASTSIGQEGLDFHNYCRRIVHWNLPSNPIDLEQREGRINRFKCLAIRQNVARRYGNVKFKTNNIWNEMFDEAYYFENGVESSDLIPFWGLNDSEDMIKIERIVPMYPFSRDIIKYDRLINILSLYRLTLGQSRQEYLLDYIFRNYDADEDFKELFINLSPYYKSNVKDFKDKYAPTDLPFLKENEKKEDINLIYIESQKYNLPINEKYCRWTTNDNSNLNKVQFTIDVDLSEYWLQLTEKLKNLNIFEELVKKDYKGYFIPISDMFMTLIRYEMLVGDGFLKVQLYGNNIKGNDSLFDYLFDKKDMVEKGLGFEVYWDEKRGGSWNISIFLPFDLNQKTNWEDAINWHIFMSKRFDEVFTPLIKEFYSINPIEYNEDLRSQYWLKLNEYVEKTSFKIIQNPHSEPWYTLIVDNLPYDDGHIDLHAYVTGQIKVSIILFKHRQDLYGYLLKNKDYIENKLGFQLEWGKQRGTRRIGVENSIDIKFSQKWESAINWHLNIAEKFNKVFSPIIKEFYREYH